MIRPYRETDHAAVYDVCVRTADAGGDARGKYHTDDLMPDLFAGPYVFLEPEFAFVLDDGNRAVGYVIGTPDTAAFARAYRARWIPRLAGRYPVPPDPPTSQEEEMLALHHHPERLVWPGLDGVPGAPAHRPAAAVPGGRPRPGPDGDVLRRRGAGRGGRGARHRDHAPTPGRSASTIASASAGSRSQSRARPRSP